MEDAIDLTSGLEAVRRRPSMYFNTDSNLMNQFVLGAMCLALAELHCGSATQIDVMVDENNFTIRDNGLGLSLDDSIDGVPFAERVMTVLGACRDHKAHASLGHELCGVGLAAVNAVSHRATIEIGTGSELHTQAYEWGVPTGSFASEAQDGSAGTTVSFSVASKFAGESAFGESELRESVAALDIEIATESIRFGTGDCT